MPLALQTKGVQISKNQNSEVLNWGRLIIKENKHGCDLSYIWLVKDSTLKLTDSVFIISLIY